MPNPVRRLLKWKTNGEKKIPDFYNLTTGLRRRTETKISPESYGEE